MSLHNVDKSTQSEPIDIDHLSRIGSFITSLTIAPVSAPIGLIKVIGISLNALRGKEPKPNEIQSSALLMIPFVGPILSNHYKNTGKIEGFHNHSLFQQFVSDYICNIPETIYNGDSRTKCNGLQKRIQNGCVDYYEDEVDIDSLNKCTSYYENPTIEGYLSVARDKNLPSVIRSLVKVKSLDGRMHDGFLRLAPKNSYDSQTLVMYHGNGCGPEMFSDSECEYFHSMGYNVFISSYAGDSVSGKKIQDTTCTEKMLIEDAMADLTFLKGLGVKEIAVLGYSLGGAQALNLMAQIDDEIDVPFIILDKTFTSGYEAAAKFTENRFPLVSSLVYIAAKEQFAIHQQKNKLVGDGLNNERKLRCLGKKKPFQKTELILFSAKKDEFLGTKNFLGSYSTTSNLTFQLQKSALLGGFKNVYHFMDLDGGHCSTIWGKQKVVMVSSSGKEESIKSITKSVGSLIKRENDTGIEKILEKLEII